MSERKTGVPRTNLYVQLNNLRRDILNGVLCRCDRGLSIKGWAMIGEEVRSATPHWVTYNIIYDIITKL